MKSTLFIVVSCFLASIAIAQTSTPTPRGPYKRHWFDPAVEENYIFSVRTCYFFPREKLASDLGIRSTDITDIAKAWSNGYRKGIHQNATELGCLEGLIAPGAGQRKAFSK